LHDQAIDLGLRRLSAMAVLTPALRIRWVLKPSCDPKHGGSPDWVSSTISALAFEMDTPRLYLISENEINARHGYEHGGALVAFARAPARRFSAGNFGCASTVVGLIK
jgi:hypothetical protein